MNLSQIQQVEGRELHALEREGGSITVYYTLPGFNGHMVVWDSLDHPSPRYRREDWSNEYSRTVQFDNAAEGVIDDILLRQTAIQRNGLLDAPTINWGGRGAVSLDETEQFALTLLEAVRAGRKWERDTGKPRTEVLTP